MNITYKYEINNLFEYQVMTGKNYSVGKLNTEQNNTSWEKEKLEYLVIKLKEDTAEEFNINHMYYIKKIVFSLFQDYINDKNVQQHSIEKKKLLINKFEKVVKSIRYKVLDDKTIFRQIDDDLELLMQLSEVHSISDCLEELIDEYLNMYNKRYLLICLYNEREVCENEYTKDRG